MKELDFERGAQCHEWKDCFFNELCPKFVGAAKKVERKAKADKYKLDNAQGNQYAGKKRYHGRGRGHGGRGRRGRY